jgi:fused signal recognition particle receptor
VISQAGGDPGAVMFDAIARCDRARHRCRPGGYGRALADPAPPDGGDPQGAARHPQGRSERPHETLLVLDANTGQNALAQVKAFDDALGLTGLVLTKLDGSAKGGVVAAIAKERRSRSVHWDRRRA